jgi:kynurenine formamidase
MTAAAGEAPLSAADFRALYERLRRTVTWGPGDRRGALNYITPSRVVAAAGGVTDGRTVSLAATVEHEPAADNPQPWRHELTRPPGGRAAPAGLDFAMDTLSLHVHGNADSHLDALSHVIYDATLYNDVAAEPVTTAARELSVDVTAGQGIVGRGVLLDIPRLRGTGWLEPGEHVSAGDLAAAEQAQQVRADEGDLVFVRVGHRRRRKELGPWDAATARAGLHPSALELLAERRIAVLGGDGNNDTAPSAVEGVAFPVHVLAVRALGVPLLDYLMFEDLVSACQATGRWSFLCVIAPLRLPSGTGSPVNPVAVF